MFKRIAAWLNIYDKEISLFAWCLALLFLVRSSSMLLNNYAETAFLKRYGVQYMPAVNMLNAVATVIVMGFMFGLVRKYRAHHLLGGQFGFCGASVLALRIMIPLGLDSVYPILFMLKVQYEALLAMLFWNLANDLFNTRQSKRLFPLLTAGGVIGQIVASFSTPWMAEMFQFDNLLVAYLIVTLIGTGVVWDMGRRYPLLLIEEDSQEPAKKDRSMFQEIQAIRPLLKESTLLRLMVILTLMPNVVIPIMNYQFNFAIDSQFANESGLIAFFGYFRGVLNIVSLIILLFVGKIYGRWGLPVALMFHPCNYVLAFLAFLFRFDLWSAIYARTSTNILRTTINVPANAMVMGLFPVSYRSLIRPFLRGTVVRAGLFLGSGLILLSENWFHARYLSLVALPFVLIWLAAPIILKRRYVSILLDLISREQLDLKSMEANDIGQLFNDAKMQDQLRQAFLTVAPAKALWFARLLRQLQYPALDAVLIRRLRDLKTGDQSELLALFSQNPPRQVIEKLVDYATGAGHRNMEAVLRAVNRMNSRVAAQFDRQPYLEHPVARIRALAASGLYMLSPGTYGPMIEQWLLSPDPETRLAGVLAAGDTGDSTLAPKLMAVLQPGEAPRQLKAAMDGLHGMGLHDLNRMVAPFLSHDDQDVCISALSAYHIENKQDLQIVMPRLGDEDARIRQVAIQRIDHARFVDGKTLIKGLNSPNPQMRESIFHLLDKLQIKDLDLFRFARDQIEGAYKYLAESAGLEGLAACEAGRLLEAHLVQQHKAIVDRVLRVLAIQDRSDRLRIIRRGLASANARERSNSQEALDDLLDRKLSRILVPLLEENSHSRVLEAGRRYFKLVDFSDDPAGLCNHLLSRSDDRLAVVLTLYLLCEQPRAGTDPAVVKSLAAHDDIHIREMARRALAPLMGVPPKEEHGMTAALSLPDIILRLQSVEIFEGLSVNELAAVASITQEVDFEADHVVIHQDEPGDTMFLIIEGQVAVIITQENGKAFEVDRMAAGEHFGEMALFEDIPRTATIRTMQPCRMLRLHKQEFNEMVRQYPQIALEICKVFSGRIRRLHQKLS